MPNIIIITTHDTGRHFGCYGVDTVHTPAIDAIADDGFKFTNYFTTSPVCSPSRGAMLTGRYPQSNGLIGLTHSPWDWCFNEGSDIFRIFCGMRVITRLFLVCNTRRLIPRI